MLTEFLIKVEEKSLFESQALVGGYYYNGFISSRVRDCELFCRISW